MRVYRCICTSLFKKLKFDIPAKDEVEVLSKILLYLPDEQDYKIDVERIK